MPGFREARNEAEALRQRLASAEAHAERLQRDNQELRMRLGEPEEPASPTGGGILMLTAPEQAQSRVAQADEHQEAVSQADAEATRERPAQPSAQLGPPLLTQDLDADDSPPTEQLSTHADAARTLDMSHANRDVGDREAH